MLQDDLTQPGPDAEPPITRIGDVAAMLRVMRPLSADLPDPTLGRRRLLADLCRFIGVKVGSLPPEALGLSPNVQATPTSETPGDCPAPINELSPPNGANARSPSRRRQ